MEKWSKKTAPIEIDRGIISADFTNTLSEFFHIGLRSFLKERTCFFDVKMHFDTIAEIQNEGSADVPERR